MSLFKNISVIKSLIFLSLSFVFINCFLESKNDATKVQSLIRDGAVWIPDNGDGTYKNPIIYADYSDPDVIRVGEDYYLTSSSFANFPGLPILHSKDLVNWEIINHAVLEYPLNSFNKPQHGNGIWAPSIRYHDGEFYIYFGDPDNGIFMTKTNDIYGKWEPLHQVRQAKGWIDPCPLWDEDGQAYLVHAWARSRSGIKHRITINKLSKDGKKILDEGKTVFLDSINHPTMEGPKFYKRNGYYYIFAPAGGVKPGWQVVLRSKKVYGPYDDKIVLEQGSTNINGPHQGGWVDDQNGKSWFVHFQDRNAYGRIVHLEPMKWVNDWPEIGEDYDNNGIGEPVPVYEKTEAGKSFALKVPATNDEFDSTKLGLQWQWEGNYDLDTTTGNSKWISLNAKKGWLRFFSQALPDSAKNLWDTPCLLLQKFPAPKFSTTVDLDFSPKSLGEKAGLLIFGLDYSFIGVTKTEKGLNLIQAVCTEADKGNEEKIVKSISIQESKIFLKVDVIPDSNHSGFPICKYSYSKDGKNFISFGEDFIAQPGKWIGAKVGLFSISEAFSNDQGYTDFNWIRFSD